MTEVIYTYQAFADRKGDPTASKGHAGFAEWEPTQNTVGFLFSAQGVKPAWGTARRMLRKGTVLAQNLTTGARFEISGPHYTIKFVKRNYGGAMDLPWAETPLDMQAEASSSTSGPLDERFGVGGNAVQHATADQGSNARSSPETIRDILADAQKRIAAVADVPILSIEISLRISDPHRVGEKNE